MTENDGGGDGPGDRNGDEFDEATDGEGGEDLEELREQTRGTDRISAETTTERETASGAGDGAEEAEETEDEPGGPEPPEGFDEAFERNLRHARNGVNPRGFSADDPGLAAFLLTLQETGAIDEVGEAIREGVGAPEPPGYDQDTVVRLALTYAIRGTAPEYFERLAETSG